MIGDKYEWDLNWLARAVWIAEREQAARFRYNQEVSRIHEEALVAIPPKIVVKTDYGGD